MSRVNVGEDERVIDHSYSLPSSILSKICWLDSDTGDYGYKVFDSTKNETLEKEDKCIPGQLSIGRKLSRLF